MRLVEVRLRSVHREGMCSCSSGGEDLLCDDTGYAETVAYLKVRHMYTALLECVTTPGQDGRRYALFLISSSVVKACTESRF